MPTLARRRRREVGSTKEKRADSTRFARRVSSTSDLADDENSRSWAMAQP